MGRQEQTKRRGRWLKQPDLVAAINHPLRVELLSMLRDREASPSEIAKELGEELGVVNYHARKLESLGMVEIVRERPVRGSTEHFYKATARPWWTTEEWARLDPNVRAVATAWAVDRLIADAATALNAGTFDARDERHLSRTPAVLDETGWNRVSEILDEALDAIIEEQAASTERRAESGELGIPTVIGMLAFEVPPPSRPE
jgi:DNA-binding transcriptional ArsR family regulator